MRLHAEIVDKMRWWLGWWVTGDAARHGRGYMAASRMSYYLQGELATEADPAERAEILRSMAACDLTMARAHVPAFGLVPAAVSGGSERSKDHELASLLLGVLADVEDCLVKDYMQPSSVAVDLLGSEAWRVVQRMIEMPDLRERHALLADFYAAILPVVGSQAAEVVANIPAPDCPPLPPYVPPADRATATTEES